MNRLIGLTVGLLLTTSAIAAPVLICKKRTQQSYSAFYRVEIEQIDGALRFEYGVGDSLQTFEYYFRSPVQKLSEAHYESEKGTGSPELEVDLVRKRNKTELKFSVLNPGGKIQRRQGYICE